MDGSARMNSKMKLIRAKRKKISLYISCALRFLIIGRLCMNWKNLVFFVFWMVISNSGCDRKLPSEYKTVDEVAINNVLLDPKTSENAV